MRFGIDFGTTRTVMAAVDRGNYPVVNTVDPEGDFFDYLPSVVAVDNANEGRIVAGWKALALEGVECTRSFKRVLSGEDVTARTPVQIGDELRPISEVLLAFASEVARQLRRYQAELGDTTATEAVLGVPANASSAQRLLTIDAFTRAGVRVLGLVNEPSAAAFEYTHRHERTLNTKRSSILVYDLGGGTFDVSLIKIEGNSHKVITSRGVSRLGGDNFDESLLDLALSRTGRSDDALGRRVRMNMLEEARTAKEQLKPQSRRLILEIGGRDVTIPVQDYYEASDHLVATTLELLSEVVGHEDSLADTDIAGIYLVGGASALPMIPRVLRERYARRVHRSP
ncbi:MAG TPA: Hsp70 family protein, partial [Corynebacterium sp.]|nr:Hsp70 family protein [Corynebacterium sp.]